jgi:hypothetical protein
MITEHFAPSIASSIAHVEVGPHLTDHELATLARSHESKVRAAVAEREATPLTSLILLAQDASPAVGCGVARNPRVDMPLSIRQDLARDKSPEVIFALIANPAVPHSIIARLARARHKEYSAAARRRLARTDRGGFHLFGMAGAWLGRRRRRAPRDLPERAAGARRRRRPPSRDPTQPRRTHPAPPRIRDRASLAG